MAAGADVILHFTITTRPNLPTEPSLPRTAKPPQTMSTPDAPSPPDFSPADPLDALLDAEAQGERWIRLDAETLLRAADFRRIKQGGHSYGPEQMIGGRRHHVLWPLPALTINGDLELSYPVWTVDELLAVIGAEVVEPPRTQEGMEWVIGEPIPQHNPFAKE